ncbi:MAG: ABC transporter substrate-binding protein, partial [Candidatus Binatia bacterium]
STKDLKGAKIGVTGAGGLSESVAVAAMKKLGFQRDKDYIVLYVGNSPLRMIALEQGRVDASIFSPQQQIVLVSKGYPMLTDVGRLLPDIPALILSTTREKTKSNSDQAVRFLRAMNRSMNLIKSDPDRALEDARKQKYGGDFKAEREALKYYYDSFSIGFNAANVESLIELSGLKTSMKPADFFDPSFGAKAQR